MHVKVIFLFVRVGPSQRPTQPGSDLVPKNKDGPKNKVGPEKQVGPPIYIGMYMYNIVYIDMHIFPNGYSLLGPLHFW